MSLTVENVGGLSLLILVPIFLYAIYVSLKFQFGAEGKDERGQMIINKAYMAASPIFPIGWLLETLSSDYIYEMSYEGYRMYMWILLLLTFIIQGMVTLHYKRKM